MTVKIVTDSAADLPAGVADSLGITVVPLNVRFGTDVYRDGIDLTNEQFYQRLKQSKVLPTTSVPAPNAFAEVYDKLAQETREILVITLSSKLSATYEVALQSIGLMKRKCRIEVIDSRWAIMAQGFVVIAAAKAANNGASLDEVIKIARETMSRVDFRATFDTLEYLLRGGRIGRAQAFLGSILKMNPIIGIRDGEVFPFARERSRGKALDHIYKFAASFSHIDELAIEDATTPQDAEKLIERLSAKFPRERIYRSKVAPVVGTHTGPGLIIVTVMGDKK
ncbi:MAG: DegV family protein [Chloroflexi bacterium]|nr:DegV family protein [Chloroflexota bacterium]